MMIYSIIINALLFVLMGYCFFILKSIKKSIKEISKDNKLVLELSAVTAIGAELTVKEKRDIVNKLG